MSTKVRPCLSVVIPCYNEEATIQSLINLVLDSKWVAEIIVVDDGSKDRSREILASVKVLPAESRTVTTGWVVSAAPEAPATGVVVKASAAGAPGPLGRMVPLSTVNDRKLKRMT